MNTEHHVISKEVLEAQRKAETAFLSVAGYRAHLLERHTRNSGIAFFLLLATFLGMFLVAIIEASCK